MLGLLVGLVAGGAAMWMWRGRLERMVQDRSPEFRSRLADQLGRLEVRAEGAMDTVREQMRSKVRAGQDYLRSGQPGPDPEAPHQAP